RTFDGSGKDIKTAADANENTFVEFIDMRTDPLFLPRETERYKDDVRLRVLDLLRQEMIVPIKKAVMAAGDPDARIILFRFFDGCLQHFFCSAQEKDAGVVFVCRLEQIKH